MLAINKRQYQKNMEPDNSVTEVEMREIGAGGQPGLKRIRSNSEEENNSKGKNEKRKKNDQG